MMGANACQDLADKLEPDILEYIVWVPKRHYPAVEEQARNTRHIRIGRRYCFSEFRV